MASKYCTAADCERPVGPHGARGFCSFHYKRVLAHGSPLAHIPAGKIPHAVTFCNVHGCGLRAHAHELCGLHLQRMERTGQTDPLIKPTAEERFWAMVDKSGDCWEWTGSCHPKGHGYFGLDGKVTYAHRVSWTMAYGDLPEGLQVNHHCDNPPCVQPEHLYAGTQIDNINDMIERGRAWWQKEVSV